MASGQRKLYVLVADDVPDCADSLALLLRLDGHEVEVARDGLAAVALARQRLPDVALLDLQMRGLDGLVTCQHIKALAQGRQPLVCALTGLTDAAIRQKAEAAGFDRYLVKPVEPAEIQQLLEGFAHQLAGGE
jgi:CheY-like chemotaxis protein